MCSIINRIQIERENGAIHKLDIRDLTQIYETTFNDEYDNMNKI